MKENHVDILFKAPYYTLNEFTEKTQTIWLVCHGYGQLSKFFMKKFQSLEPSQHFLVFPQGLSKFYLDLGHDRVGATWMTREDRLTDIQNQYSYLDRVLKETVGDLSSDVKVNFFGFSQGVATICRYLVYKKYPVDQLILWAGGLPNELTAKDFAFLKDTAVVHMLLGNQDQYYTEKTYLPQVDKAKKMMGDKVRFTIFEGGHRVDASLLGTL